MWSVLFLLACQEDSNDGMFAITSGNSEEEGLPEDTTDTEDAMLEDTGDKIEDEPEPSSEPSLDDCEYDDATFNEDPNNLEGRVECGAAFYAEACTGCHGANGEGTPSGQQLVGHIDGHTDAQLIQSIVEGEGSMPAYDMVHPQMIADVVAYMRANFSQ